MAYVQKPEIYLASFVLHTQLYIWVRLHRAGIWGLSQDLKGSQVVGRQKRASSQKEQHLKRLREAKRHSVRLFEGNVKCAVSETGWKTGVTEVQVRSEDCTLLRGFKIVLSAFLD